MTIKARCPGCSAAFNLADEKQGKKIRCPKCQAVFPVGAADKAKPNGAKPAAIQRKPAAVKKPVRNEDVEDERPAARKAPAAAIRSQDDDDEEQPRARPASQRARKGSPDLTKKPQSNPGLMIGVIAGGAVLLLLLLGGGSFAVYFFFFRVPPPSTTQQAATTDPPAPPPMTLDVALQNLGSGDQSKCREALDWLTTKTTVDKNRQADVSRALNPLLKSPDVQMREQTVSALKVWGATKENMDGLLQILNDANPLTPQNPDLIVAVLDLLGPLQDERAVEPVWRYRVTGHLTDQADRSLQAMGQAAGEKAALKRMNDPVKWNRDAGRGLLTAYKATDAAKLAQAKLDIGAPEKERKLAACEYLTTTPVVEAERPGVAQTLNAAVNDPDFGVVEAAVKALGQWYTADNVETLAAAIGKNDFRERAPAMAILGKLKDARGAAAVVGRLIYPQERQAAADALIAMGPAAVPELTKFEAAATDQSVRNECDRIIKAMGADASGAQLGAALSDLTSADANRRSAAALALGKMQVDQAQQAKVAKALETASADGSDLVTQERSVRALLVWGTKDNAPTLLKIVDERKAPANTRYPAMDFLAKVKCEDAIVPIAKHLTGGGPGDLDAATSALIAMGPESGAKIEVLVVDGLKSNDKQTVKSICKILGAVGTKACIPALQTMSLAFARQKVTDLQQAAVDALNAVVLRVGMK